MISRMIEIILCCFVCERYWRLERKLRSRFVEGYTDKASFSLKMRADQVEYIRDNPLGLNVIPNLSLPKTK